MEIVIPVVPAAFLVVLSFLSPYAVSFLGNFDWSPAKKKWLAIGVSVVLTAAVFLVAWAFGAWTPDLSPPGLVTAVLLALATQQAAYGLVFKESADDVMRNVGPNKAGA